MTKGLIIPTRKLIYLVMERKEKAKRAEKDGNLHETRLQVVTWQAVFVPMSLAKRNLFLPTKKHQRMQKFIKK